MAQFPMEGEDDKTENKGPDCAVSDNLIGAGRFKERPVKRKEPPENIGA